MQHKTDTCKSSPAMTKSCVELPEIRGAFLGVGFCFQFQQVLKKKLIPVTKHR